jgi:hypothetical protein
LTAAQDPDPTDRFAPAEDREPAAGGGSAIASWAAGGLAAGMLAGLTASAFATVPWASPLGAALGLAAGAVTGLGVGRWERQAALARPTVPDALGQPTRPVHAAVHVVPGIVAVVCLLAQAALLSTFADSPAPAAASAALALGAAWWIRRVVAEHLLIRAIEHLESANGIRGAEALRRIAASRWLPRRTRESARLDLGLIALSEGALDDAEDLLDTVAVGPAGAWAGVGRSMIHVLRGDLPVADETLADVLCSRHALNVQPQADAVRLLLVLRREGPPAASTLGEHLLDTSSTPLFRAILASLRRASGDLGGSAQLLTARASLELRSSGLARKIPELEPILFGGSRG